MIHAVRDGLDIHTATACHLFHLTSPWDLQNPHGSVVDTDWRSHVQWRGKDDSRRGIAKNFRYGTQYCLKPEAVLSIKNLEQFDLSREEILELAHRYWNLTAAQQTAKFAHMQRIKRDEWLARCTAVGESSLRAVMIPRSKASIMRYRAQS